MTLSAVKVAALSRPLMLIGVGGVVIACTLTALGIVRPPVLLTWNATPSVPTGLYLVSKAAYRRGELVLVETPSTVRALAATRRYLPSGVHLAKRIAAVSGDQICAQNNTIFINGAAVAERAAHDSEGRVMPAWTGCRVLQDEVFLLLPEVAASFDGRYFGPVSMRAVIGKMTPLWTD
jgi:conjugative transfer signal peptidase TraF